MRSFVLQDWVTIRGTATTILSVTQTASDYLDLEAFEDAVAWVEIRELTTGGGTIALAVQSAPIKEDIFFTPNNVVPPVIGTAPGVYLASFVLNNLVAAPSTSPMPLSRWLRWKIAASGTSSAWDITFRIHVAAHSLSLASA